MQEPARIKAVCVETLCYLSNYISAIVKFLSVFKTETEVVGSDELHLSTSVQQCLFWIQPQGIKLCTYIKSFNILKTKAPDFLLKCSICESDILQNLSWMRVM